MVNTSLIQAILRAQDDPGAVTTRQLRDLYNARSGEDIVVQHTDVDVEFQAELMKALEGNFVGEDNDDGKPISYTVKLKDGDETPATTTKRRSIIKLTKESKKPSDSEETASDSEKGTTASSITIGKPFSPLFLNNMKKFGVSSDWLAKRSNSIRQSSFSRSSIKSNTSKLDAMIKSASIKPIRSSRKLSFTGIVPTKNNENVDPIDEDKKPEPEPPKRAASMPTASTAYDLSSEVEEDEQEEKIAASPTLPSQSFTLRIPRVDLSDESTARSSKRTSSSSSSDTESKPIVSIKKAKKKKRTSTPKTTTDEIKKPTEKKDKDEQALAQIENLKKLLRTAGIRLIIKKAELDVLPSNKAKIVYLKSLFSSAGFTGHFTMKDCKKFCKRRDRQRELLDLQANSVDVQGHVKGGRMLRGSGPIMSELSVKRKRTPSTEVEDNDDDDDNKDLSDVEPIVKRRRILQVEASPEVSDCEQID